MSLNKTSLQSDLKTWMQTPRSSQSQAGQDLETLYHNYILGAVDISGDSVNNVITNSIVNAIIRLTLLETYTTSAQKIADGFTAYWTGATFQLLYPPAGTISPEISAVVTTPPVSSTFASSLISIFSNLNTDIDTRASQLATAIDTMTKTVIVTCIGTLANPPYSLAVIGHIS
jgi:hypothetical protein